MSQSNITVDQLPPGALAYNYATLDQPGVASSPAVNNFLSVFNPVGSTKTIAWLAASIHRYTIGSSQTAVSLAIYRTTAASAGTLIAASVVTKFDQTQANCLAEVRVGNPTVTLLNSTVIFGASPPISTGAGNTSAVETTTPGTLAISHPGEGLVFQTANGNTNQMWGFQLSWAEF